MTDNLYLQDIGKKAKTASKQLSVASSEVKNKALEAMAQALTQNAETIIDENKKDLWIKFRNSINKLFFTTII